MKLHVEPSDVPAIVREAVHATLHRAGVKIVTQQTGRRLNNSEEDAVLRAIGKDVAQRLSAIDSNPENAT